MNSGIESHLSEVTHVIQLAVAPVFLLTAVATLISALTVRLGRIVDRRRVVEDRMRPLESDEAKETRPSAEWQLLLRRTRLIYYAILAAVTGALLVCFVVATAFLGALLGVDLSRTVAILFIVAMLSIIACLMIFLREVFLAVTGPSHRLQ